jgi:hypothetical protein
VGIKTSMGIVPTYRKNLPSPRVQIEKSYLSQFDSNNVQGDDTKQNGYESFTPQPYQCSGTLTFEYDGATYELRDGVFNKESAKLMDVHNDNNLV